MDISVVLCTYNRSKDLKNALESLLSQEETEGFSHEIMVVDNNSKDGTKDLVENYIAKFNVKIRYIFEVNQGLSYARNRGIKEARGKIIAFTDDDVIVDKLWLNNIYTMFKKNNCDATGGRILPLLKENTPEWIKDNLGLLSGPLVIYDYGNDTQEYNKDTMIPFFGANMAFRKELFNFHGLFRTDLGMGQGKIGEETEFFRRLEKTNKNIYYCGNALVWHKVDNKRMNLRHIAKWWIASGRFAVATNYDKPADNFVYFFGMPRYLIKKIVCDMAGLILEIFNTKAFLKKWNELFWNIGRVYEYRRK